MKAFGSPQEDAVAGLIQRAQRGRHTTICCSDLVCRIAVTGK